MNISFQGIKNTSFIIDQDEYCKFDKTRYLNSELTDDQYGKDLTCYKKLIKDFPEFENPFRKNFINIAHYKKYDVDTFQLNGKYIPEHDKYIPLFSFISKLTDKISKIPEKAFFLDLEYLKSNYADYALLLDRRISEEVPKPIDEVIESIHNPTNIKRCAKNISKGVIRSMLEYFKT